MKRLTSKLAQCKQWLIYYVRRMLPEHKCKYCGCMTRQPDSECYARPEQAITPNVWLYVFGFATHIFSFKAQKQIGKTDIYNVLPPVNY